MLRLAAPLTASEQVSDCGTLDVAKLLGMAVRSVQLMVDRGGVDAWRTPGGHRRIARASVDAWLSRRAGSMGLQTTEPMLSSPVNVRQRPRVLLVEDSTHCQSLISKLIAQQFPEVELHIASDCIVGLVIFGQLQPELLMTDVLLPGIDGATLVSRLHSMPQFADRRLIIVTSLNVAQLAPYAFLLEDVPVVHKSRLMQELPGLLRQLLFLGRAA